MRTRWNKLHQLKVTTWPEALYQVTESFMTPEQKETNKQIVERWVKKNAR